MECVQKLANSLRRNAKDERVLFHYNGHGVPLPTDAGEIWVYNQDITQYIPLSLVDLMTWMRSPSVYVWDCHSAGTVVKMFNRFVDDQHRIAQVAGGSNPFINDVGFGVIRSADLLGDFLRKTVYAFGWVFRDESIEKIID